MLSKFSVVAILLLAVGVPHSVFAQDVDCDPKDPLCVGRDLEAQLSGAPSKLPSPAPKKEASRKQEPSAWKKATEEREAAALGGFRKSDEALAREKAIEDSKKKGKQSAVVPRYESIEGLKSSQDAEGNWNYDFSSDGISAAVEMGLRVTCEPPREKVPLPCFDEYYGTFKSDPNFPNFDIGKVKKAYVKMLQCMDKCVTIKDAEYLANCVNWERLKTATQAAENLPDYFDLIEKGGLSQCADQDRYTAIMKGFFGDSHSEGGKCRRTGFKDFQYGRWEDPIILIANAESTLAEIERLTGVKDRSKTHENNLTFANNAIDGLASQHSVFAPDAQVILLDQHSGRKAERISIHDPELVAKAKSLIKDWETSGCGDYCLPLDQATLKKLPAEAAKVKAGQRLFDTNAMGQYTTAPVSSKETKRAMAVLDSGNTGGLKGEDPSNMNKRAATDAQAGAKRDLELPVLPAGIATQDVEVLLDGSVLKAQDYSFDSTSRQLKLRKELPTQGLHLIRMVYPEYF